MRHAKSDWTTGNDDFQRPLNKRGEEDAPFMGKIISSIERVPDLIYVSAAMRTKQTASLCVQGMQFKGDVSFKEELYEGDTNSVLNVLQKTPEKYQRIMLVGHNTYLEELISSLICANKINLHFPTAAIAIFEAEIESWKQLKQSSSCLLGILIPKMLRKLPINSMFKL